MAVTPIRQTSGRHIASFGCFRIAHTSRFASQTGRTQDPRHIIKPLSPSAIKRQLTAVRTKVLEARLCARCVKKVDRPSYNRLRRFITQSSSIEMGVRFYSTRYVQAVN